MNNTNTIKEVLDHLEMEMIMLKIKFNSLYSSDPETALQQSEKNQAKRIKLKIVQQYLENLIEEQS